MDLRPLTDTLSVAPQIAIEDLAQIAELGFKTLICNRPDAEEPGQPALADIQSAAEALGMAFIHQPVISGAMSMDDARTFGELLEQAEDSVLAYCRSGTRSSTLWALSQAPKTDVDDILQRCMAAGYNYEGMRATLEQLNQQGSL